MPQDFAPAVPYYSRLDWQRSTLLFISCFGVHALSLSILPPFTLLYPAAGIALVGLFFAGIRLWPAPFIGLVLAGAFVHVEMPLTYLAPAAITLQAALGAHLLQRARIDPMFRRHRDAFYVIVSLVLVSLTMPTLFLLIPGDAYAGWRWSYSYIATVCTLLVTVPFLLRWVAKPRFRRPLPEAIETLFIFGVLIAIDLALFVFHVTDIFGVLMLYLLLVPFFWIAIRLRPRWITTAVVLTAGFALVSVFRLSDPSSLMSDLYAAELFLIALAISFYTIASMEEDRHASTNLVRSQLATLENAVSRISSESQAKNDFIAILAHELRNPLAPVVSAIELMKIRGTQTPEEAESLEIMESSMQTVKRLLDDLLDISRISEGKIALKTEVVDLGHVVRRAVVSTAHLYKERHQALAFVGSKKELRVHGDPVRLEQIFTNLLSNASRYSNSGDTVNLSVKEKSGMAEVRVQDTGIGIAPEVIDTVFLPFYQLQPGKQNKKGLGIGLALVQSFVEMHQGQVRAESPGEGKGSTFIVRLPLADEALPKTRKPRSRTDLPRRKTGPRVLVVDDNDAAAAGIGRLLELQGCTIAYAYSGAQALEFVGEINPDVTILDIGMQDQDGYTVARILRTRGYAGTLVALSGFSTPEAREKGFAAGFDHYLVKPAGLNELRKAIPGMG